MSVSISLSLYPSIHLYIYMNYVYVYINIYVLYVCISVYMSICIYNNKHTRTHAHAHAHISCAYACAYATSKRVGVGDRGHVLSCTCVFVCLSFFSACVWVVYLCIKRPHERWMRVSACECDLVRSAVDSAAVSTIAKDSKAKSDSRSDSRADRPRRYRPVRSARRHMCGSRRCRACVPRDSARRAVVFLCDGTLA
jgi:hypothetical protein